MSAHDSLPLDWGRVLTGSRRERDATSAAGKARRIHWPSIRVARTLRGSLFLLVAAVSIPLVGLAVYAVRTVGAAEQARSEEAVMGQARALSLAVDAEFSRIRGMLRPIAASPTLIGGNIEEFRPLAEAVANNLEESSVAVVQRDGTRLLGTGLAANVNLDPLVMQVFENGADLVSDLLFLSNRPVISVAVPVRRDEAVVAAIVVGLRTEVLRTMMRGQRIPVGWAARIVDRSGAIVAHSHPRAGTQWMQPFPRFIAPMGAAGEGLTTIAEVGGSSSIVAFARAPLSGYTTAVSVPVEDFNAPLTAVLMKTSLIGAGFLFAGMVMATLMSGRIRRGVRVLTTLADRGGAPGHSGLREIDEAAAVISEALMERHQAEADLSAANTSLQRAVAERDLLLREVYHRVKNNLQVVDSLIAMQANRLPEGEPKAGLLATRMRINALGLVHQQLMTSDDLATFGLQPFLVRLAQNLATSTGAAARGIVITPDIDPIQATLEFAGPLGLLVTEIVSNSMKHAFPARGGQIVVQLRVTRMGCVVRVSDDGIGAASGPPARSGLGTRIITGLVKQLGGSMRVGSGPGYSTEITLPLPGAK